MNKIPCCNSAGSELCTAQPQLVPGLFQDFPGDTKKSGDTSCTISFLAPATKCRGLNNQRFSICPSGCYRILMGRNKLTICLIRSSRYRLIHFCKMIWRGAITWVVFLKISNGGEFHRETGLGPSKPQFLSF